MNNQPAENRIENILHSNIRFAKRLKFHIAGAAIRSSALETLAKYLDIVLEKLDQFKNENSNNAVKLNSIREKLELIERALYHYHIAFPFNQTLFINPTLSESDREDLQEIARYVRLKTRHLRMVK